MHLNKPVSCIEMLERFAVAIAIQNLPLTSSLAYSYNVSAKQTSLWSCDKSISEKTALEMQSVLYSVYAQLHIEPNGRPSLAISQLPRVHNILFVAQHYVATNLVYFLKLWNLLDCGLVISRNSIHPNGQLVFRIIICTSSMLTSEYINNLCEPSWDTLEDNCMTTQQRYHAVVLMPRQ